MIRTINFDDISLFSSKADIIDGSSENVVEMWDRGQLVAKIKATDSLFSNSLWDPKRDGTTLNNLKNKLREIQEENWGKN